jgi:Ser/Thr protein kinase RdoA (MazF antagonist)
MRAPLSISAKGPVPEPKSTPEGERVLGISADGHAETKLPVVLFGWVDGSFLRHRFLPGHLRQVGRLTARLHKKTSQFAPPAGFCRGTVDLADEDTEERLGAVFKAHSKEAETLAGNVLHRVRLAQGTLGSGPDAFGFIHADIHQGNYLFNHGKVALIDFGDCGWGHYLYDLAVTINEVRDRPNGLALRAALLAGYREVRDLAQEQEPLIDAFLLLRNVQDLTSALDSGSEPSYAHKRARADRRLARLQRALDMQSTGSALL